MSTIPIDPFLRIYNRIADGGEICSGGFDPKNNPEDRKRFIIGVVASILFVILFAVCSSCTRRIYIPVDRTTTVVKQLVDTVIQVELKEYHDTITITHNGNDTLSYLSNAHGYSFASIEDGKLGHSLGTLPGTVVSQLIKDGFVEAVDIEQKESFEAGCLFARSEGIIPAPESCHAIAAAIREANKCKEAGEEKTILFCLSGHGLIDMAAYDQYLAGNL
jgi:hypothetical protein